MKKFGMLLTAILLLGCGASVEQPATGGDAAEMGIPPGAVTDAANSENTDAQPAFRDLAFGERKVFMSDVVMPEMKPLFIEKHPAFSCASCHGDDMATVNYEMPNTLEPLNPSAMPFESEDENIRAAAVFMKETVVPKMAGLLNEAPYNPQTKSGFGCFDCHATVQN
ncbi:MAG: hypothetical protein JXX14_21015 [Deltaproteobacteria bacterium]|nr:hypothetical protein [Deltaproteobacteria bacterium]